MKEIDAITMTGGVWSRSLPDQQSLDMQKVPITPEPFDWEEWWSRQTNRQAAARAEMLQQAGMVLFGIAFWITVLVLGWRLGG